ncbi:MAG: ROK family protein [Prolixibacteraceae bacterium]
MESTINLIGVDLGGTSIRAGRITDDQIIHHTKIPTPSQGTVGEVMEQIFYAIDECINSATTSIGVGVPSVVDVDQGIVYDVVNIPSWKVVPLKELLESRYHLPVFVNNDANCFVVGEKYFGKARQFKNIVGVTLGTGLGCGLIFNGKLYEGSNCGAGEFGNVPYLSHNVEYYCSGQFFTDEKKVSAIDVFNRAKMGDSKSLKMFEEFGFHLGSALKSILYAYDPEIIILGGSVSQSFDFFKDAMFQALQDFAFSNVLANLKIEVSVLENSAIFGAAALPIIKQL